MKKSYVSSSALVAIFLSFFLSASLFAIEVEGIVTRVYDGDTLTINSDQFEKPKRVRLVGIDTPEINFNGEGQGQIALDARDYLASLVPMGSKITVDLGKKGNLYRRRLLGTIYFQGKNINLEMVKSGHAAMYFIDPVDKDFFKDYRDAAKVAFEEKSGFYAVTDIMPYQFRMIVQNKVGNNFVGDVESRTLYYPDEVDQVLPYNRLFLWSLERAEELGYQLRQD